MKLQISSSELVRYRNCTKLYSLDMHCVVVIASLLRLFLVHPSDMAGALEFKLQLLIVLELLGYQICVYSWSEYLGSNTTNQEMSLSPLESPLASQWVYETVKGFHEFKIKGYSLANGMGVGKSMISDRFTVGGYDWVIVFDPKGASSTI